MTLESLIIETSDKGGLNQFDKWEINWCFQCLTKESHLIRLEWCRAGLALYAWRPLPSEAVHEISLPLAVQSQTSSPASWFSSSFGVCTRLSHARFWATPQFLPYGQDEHGNGLVYTHAFAKTNPRHAEFLCFASENTWFCPPPQWTYVF